MLNKVQHLSPTLPLTWALLAEKTAGGGQAFILWKDFFMLREPPQEMDDE
jgi:hypothetical protein